MAIKKRIINSVTLYFFGCSRNLGYILNRLYRHTHNYYTPFLWTAETVRGSFPDLSVELGRAVKLLTVFVDAIQYVSYQHHMAIRTPLTSFILVGSR